MINLQLIKFFEYGEGVDIRMNSIYGKLSSEVYEIDKYIGKSFGDIEYYQDRLKGIEGKVLEPAVGNGRILIPLLENGLDIEGIDSSNNMLELFNKNCNERGIHTSCYKQDMSNFTINQKYEAIIVPTGSFLLLHQLEEAISSLKCFYEHLEKNGRLILDIFLPENTKEGFVSKRGFTNPQGDTIMLEETLVKIDQINQFAVYHNRYEKWRQGKLMDSELEIFPLKWYGVEEFRLILEKIGFTSIVISSDYIYNQYPTKASQIITFEATKH